jgi:hypothetical protein
VKHAKGNVAEGSLPVQGLTWTLGEQPSVCHQFSLMESCTTVSVAFDGALSF